jgi:hypothetical protein
MKIQSIGSSEKSKAAAFEQVRPKTREWDVIIEPALGAGGRRRVIKAETRAEAELKAKQMAKEMFEAECLVQFQE